MNEEVDVWPPYLADESVQRMMSLGMACARWNVERLPEISIERKENVGLVLTAFSLAHEHHDAILALVHTGRLGPALALLRPCFEALVRGLWLLRGASKEQIERYIAGKDSLKIEALLSGVAKGPNGAEDMFLRDTWDKSKDSLHQYTHVSFQLLARRMSQELMEEAVSAIEVADAIRFATATAALASVEVARLGNCREAEQQALRFLGLLYPEEQQAPVA